MHAIEFITKPLDGTIKIPQEYLKDMNDEVRVIILVQEKAKKKKAVKFEAFSVDTEGFKFNRDEANER